MCWAAQPCLAKAVASLMVEMCPLSRGCGAKDSHGLVPEIALLPNPRKVPLNLHQI